MLSCTKNHSIFFIFLYLGFFVTRLRTLLLRRTSSVAFDISGKPTRCFATSFALVFFSFSFLYNFCAEDFSEMGGPIFVKFSASIYYYINLIRFFLFCKNHFRFGLIRHFVIFLKVLVHVSPQKRAKIGS